MTLENIVLVISGTLTGLMAGLLYTFNVAIVPALRAVKGTQHIAVMQAINTKIQNPVFFLSFFGPTILLPVSAFLHRNTPEFLPLAGAAALHILGANGVTMAGNIPLNNQLDKVDANQIAEGEADRIRTEFQGRGSTWMRWHNVRTIAAILATALVFIACLSKSSS